MRKICGIPIALLGGSVSVSAALLAAYGGQGLALAAGDNSIGIINASNPVSNYQGRPGDKLTTTRAGDTATYWGSDGLLKTALANTLRRDFDPRLAAVAGRCGYLIERQRVNSLQRNTEIDNAYFTTTDSGQVTVTANAAIAPDGTMAAEKVVPNASNGYHRFRRLAVLTPDANGAIHDIFVKPAGYSKVALVEVSTSATYASFLLSGSGSVISTSGMTARIEACPDGWYRVCILRAAAESQGFGLYVLNDAYSSGSPLGSYTGDGTSGVYVWAPEVEAGTYPTSPILTAGASATREADVVTLATSEFPWDDWEGTILFEGFTPRGSGTQVLCQLDDGSEDDRFRLERNSSNEIHFIVTDEGVAQCDLNLGSVANDTFFSVTVSWSGRDFGGSLNGAAKVTAVGDTLPAVSTLRVGSSFTGEQFGGHVTKLLIVPVATDAVMVSSYEGHVMGGTHQPLYVSNSVFSFNSQSPHFAMDSGNRLKIAIPNWADRDTPGYGPVTFSASIMDANNVVLGQFLFSGSTTGVCAAGATLYSDWLDVEYEAGTKYFIRIHGDGASGIPFNQAPTKNGLNQRPDVANGSLYDQSATDKTMGGSISMSLSIHYDFCPVAIIGDTRRPSVLMVGDSLMYRGAADFGDFYDGTSPDVGYAERVLGDLGIAYSNCASPAEKAQDFVASSVHRRAALAQHFSHVWCGYGFNDVSASRSQALLMADLATIWALFPNNRIVQAQCSFRSSGAWTLADRSDQTIGPNFAPAALADNVNTAIAAASGLYGYSNYNAAIFDVSDHKWLADGTPGKYTADGIHYSQFAALEILDSGLITASLFSRAGL
jgi:hypothetical protein